MTLYSNVGKLFSVARANCPRCSGTGFYLREVRRCDATFLVYESCDCVDVAALEKDTACSNSAT